MKKICPICDLPVNEMNYCPRCRRMVRQPVLWQADYYLNERRPDYENRGSRINRFNRDPAKMENTGKPAERNDTGKPAERKYTRKSAEKKYTRKSSKRERTRVCKAEWINPPLQPCLSGGEAVR